VGLRVDADGAAGQDYPSVGDDLARERTGKRRGIGARLAGSHDGDGRAAPRLTGDVDLGGRAGEIQKARRVPRLSPHETSHGGTRGAHPHPSAGDRPELLASDGETGPPPFPDGNYLAFE
jgi:hypothetical protein